MAFRSGPLLEPHVEAVLPKKEREKARVQRERRENSKKHKAAVLLENSKQAGAAANVQTEPLSGAFAKGQQPVEDAMPVSGDDARHSTAHAPNLLSLENAFTSLIVIDDGTGSHAEQLEFCPECYVPLAPDPSPEKLFIFLHALRYTTPWGAFETEMPEWAAPN